jgi:hypothetical protein
MRELQGNAVGEARTAPRPARGTDPRRGFLVATIAAVAMTLFGAFGTGGAALLPRLLYWLLIMEAGALIGTATTIGIRAWGGLADRPLLEGAGVSVLIALPLTLVVLVVSVGFFGTNTLRIGNLLFLFVMVFAVTAMITAINYATARPESLAPPFPAPPPRPRLAERLAPHLRDSPIHALQAEDHYLRVHTQAGSELILMRISDAIPLLAPLEGARTHRSWWVARDAIEAVARKDGRAELTLPGGIMAPVSRSAYPALRDQGWFN